LADKPGVSPGLSVFDRLELISLDRKDRVQVIDLDFLTANLKAFADDVSAWGQQGHLSIAPIDEHGMIDMGLLNEWANTRISGGNHELTEQVRLAIVKEIRT